MSQEVPAATANSATATGVASDNTDVATTDTLTIAQLTKYLKGGLKEEFRQLIKLELVNKKDEPVVKFRNKAHTQQHTLNAQVLSALKQFQTYLDGLEDVDATIIALLTSTVEKLEQRQNDICVTDTSPHGWETVAELKRIKGLGDASVGAKEIRKAEESIRDRKPIDSGRRVFSRPQQSGGPIFCPTYANFADNDYSGPSSSIGGGGRYKPYQQPGSFRPTPGYSQSAGWQPAKDQCGWCGVRGHWKKQCASRAAGFPSRFASGSALQQ